MDVRARLRTLERGDPVSGTLRTLMCLQFAAVFLLAGPLSDLYAWMAYAMLAVLPATWLVGVIHRRRVSGGAEETVRRRYESSLEVAIEKAGKRRDHIWWQASASVVIGAAALLFTAGRQRDTGAVIALMLFLAALDAYQQGRWVLPRLQREQGSYRDGLIGLTAR